MFHSSQVIAMKVFLVLLAAFLFATSNFAAENESPEDRKIREAIPLGCGLKPNPQVPAFVVVGHGGRIIVSKDDGQTYRAELNACAMVPADA
jgi:photosystem II stability/assembly factor-like uncharacterized protein